MRETSTKEMRKIIESIQLDEASSEEEKFIAILNWFAAESGMPNKHNAADQLKQQYPGIEPWTWRSGFKRYLQLCKK